MSNDEFSNLEIPKMYLDASSRTYLVFKNKDEYVFIEADSAHDAIEKSGIENVHKVSNIRDLLLNTIVQEHLTADPSKQQPPTNTDPQ